MRLLLRGVVPAANIGSAFVAGDVVTHPAVRQRINLLRVPKVYWLCAAHRAGGECHILRFDTAMVASALATSKLQPYWLRTMALNPCCRWLSNPFIGACRITAMVAL